MLKKIIVVIGLSSLIGCTGHQIKKEESAFIIMKTKKIKFADLGFIYASNSKVNVEVYASGQPIVNLEINNKNICTSFFKCIEKKKFNKQVLSEYYPETLLENIFKAKPIFLKENMEKNADGFSQKIKEKNHYDISYVVTSTKRTFRDKINKIKIEVRKP